MRSALLTRVLLAAGLLATLAGVVLNAERMKAFLDGLASDGTADFFSLDLLQGLRASLLLAGPCAAALPWLMRVAERSAVPPDEQRWPRYPLFAGLLVVALVLASLARITSDPPLTKDAKFYLTTSLEIADAGGPLALPGACFRGEYREDNRHPLYPGALSSVAERSDRFSDRARLFSLAGAVLTLLLFLRLARRVWGDGPALFTGVVLLSNGTFLEHAASVACESWQMAAAVWWFDLVTRKEARPATWALAGVACGFAYLLKGTGTLFLGATGLWLLARLRLRALAPLGAFVTTFALVSLPLLWRNAKVYGTPFWNINSSKVFWLDEWKSFFDPALMEQASLSHYLSTHSIPEMVVRLASGMIKEAFHQLEIFSPLVPSAALGLPVILVLAVGLWADDDRGRRALLVLIFALFFLGFAWYAKVVQGWRFLAVLTPLLLLPVASLAARAARSEFRPARLRLVVGLVPVGLILGALLNGVLDFRPNRFQPAPEHDAVQAFLHENVGKQGALHYLLGPSDGRTVDWDNRIHGTRHPWPRTEAGFEALLDLPWGHVVRFAFVEPPDGPRADRVSTAWASEGADGALAPANPPPGWTLVESIPPERPRVLVYRRD